MEVLKNLLSLLSLFYMYVNSKALIQMTHFLAVKCWCAVEQDEQKWYVYETVV